ncbi:putative oligopeptide transporter, OPT superfamily [Dioscorea sansibarensis]
MEVLHEFTKPQTPDKMIEEVNDSPIEEVRLTVPITDDPTMPCLTFRTWTIGLTACVVLSFVNIFFGYRQNPISISSVCVQIVSLPIGKLMAATLPTKLVRIPLTNWSFSLNPGPFSLKEHVLITLFANAGASGPFALDIVTLMKAFYHRRINPVAALLLSHTTQLLGYGFAGMFRKYLVDSPYMWWPGNLVMVSLFRALNEEEKRPKGRISRLQFFMIVLISSFAYYIVPGYFFPSISALSFVCWIWKNSVTAQQIGSGYNGFGIGSFGLDWTTVSGFLGSPLANPAFAIINKMAGFILVAYVVIPIAYYTNAYNAKRYPIFTSNVYDSKGHPYNITRVLNNKTFSIDYDEYDSYGKMNVSMFFAYRYGFAFATLMASLTHVALFYGRTIWDLWRKAAATTQDKFLDVHGRIMKRNYEQVPQWWFMTILVLTLGLSFFTCEGFNRQLQLPYWGILLACAMALFFMFPIAVLIATTNQGSGIGVITEMIFGYLYPGRPLANLTFRCYGVTAMGQALWFLSDFKLGHYMKIPPKSMYIMQLAGTIVASTVSFGTAWWLLTNIKHICHADLLPVGSPWTCPGEEMSYNISIIWGVVGPNRIFGSRGFYTKMNWFFLVGLFAPLPVWLLARAFPKKKWIALINMPVIFEAILPMPAAKSVHYISWSTVGIFFNSFIYRRYKNWWARHTYVLSAGLDAGVAFLAVLAFFSLQNYRIYGLQWWGNQSNDHCPLAACPTAPGIVVKGCPTF